MECIASKSETLKKDGESMRILVACVGGTHQMLATGRDSPQVCIRAEPDGRGDGPPGQEATEGLEIRVVSIGYPGRSSASTRSEPHNLAPGWSVSTSRLRSGVRQAHHDAARQALGSYDGGKMLFLVIYIYTFYSLHWDGPRSAMIVDRIVEPMELGHLPYKKGTYRICRMRGLNTGGQKKWRAYVTMWGRPGRSPEPTMSFSEAATSEAQRVAPGLPVG